MVILKRTYIEIKNELKNSTNELENSEESLLNRVD